MKRVSDSESLETLGQSDKSEKEGIPAKECGPEVPKVVGLFKSRSAAEPVAECGPPPLFSSPPPGNEPEINTGAPHAKGVGNFLLFRAKGLPPLTTGEELPSDTVYVGPLNKLPNRSEEKNAIRHIDPDFLAEEIKAVRLPGESYERLRKELVAQGVPDAQVKVSHLNPKAQVRQMIEGFAGSPVSSH